MGACNAPRGSFRYLGALSATELSDRVLRKIGCCFVDVSWGDGANCRWEAASHGLCHCHFRLRLRRRGVGRRRNSVWFLMALMLTQVPGSCLGCVMTACAVESGAPQYRWSCCATRGRLLIYRVGRGALCR